MCGEMREVGSALLKEETEDRLPRLPLGLGPVEVVACKLSKPDLSSSQGILEKKLL